MNDTSIHSSLCTNSICTQAHRCKFCKNFLRKLKEWKKQELDQDLVSSKFYAERHMFHPKLVQERINALHNIVSKQCVWLKKNVSEEDLLFIELHNTIQNYSKTQPLSFYLLRLQDELFRMANPTTTKKFPDQIRYCWETVKFTGSDAVLDVLRGDKDCKNMWVPDSNTVNIDAHVKYGHLYTQEKQTT